MALGIGQYAPVGSFYVSRKTDTGATPFSVLIPPMVNPVGTPPYLLQPGNTPSGTLGKANVAFQNLYITRVSRVCYSTVSANAHLIQILQPLNYTWVTTAVAKNTAALTLYDDPGAFSTNYKYPLPRSSVVACTADVTMDNTYFAVVQLEDGTFFSSAVSTWSTPTLTLATSLPNVTGGGMLKNSPVWIYVPGTTQLVPDTGQISPTKNIAASLTDDVSWSDPVFGICTANNPGDPLLFYSPNTTTAGFLEYITGYYTKL